MRRQKIASHALVFALAGVMGLAGCESQPRSQRTGTTRVATTPQTQRVQRQTVTPAGAWPTRRTGGDTVWTSMAYPTGDARTSALGVEKGVPREARLNQPFTYEVVVTNLTNETLQDVVVTDRPQDDLRLTGSTPQGRAGTDGLYTWALGTLAPKETKTVKVTGVASSEGTVGTCAGATFRSALCATIPIVSPKLKLTKTGPAEVLKCEEITYRFEVSNTGTGSLRDVRISDPLPAGLTTASGGRTIDIAVGELAAGQSRQYTAKAMAERTGRFENKATATGAGDLTAESGTVATVVREPVLRITKSCPERMFIGRVIEYEMTVTNTGDGVARDTVIEDAIPANTQFVSASDGGRVVGRNVVWNVGELAADASKNVTMRVNPTGAGSVRNTVTARAYCAKPVTDSCDTTITGIPAILLEVVDIEDPDEVGTTETYVITVTNQGSAPGTNIRVVCTLEANQEYSSASGATRGTGRGNQVSFEPLAALAAKEKATWRVIVRNVQAGDTRFKVTLTSDQLTRPVEETEATNIYE